MSDSDHEPVFKRSPWGTSRYVYNHRNPLGLALIILTLAVGVVFVVMLTTKTGPFEVADERPAPDPTEVSRFLQPSLPTAVATPAG